MVVVETIERDCHRFLSDIRNRLKTVRNRGTARFVVVENIGWRIFDERLLDRRQEDCHLLVGNPRSASNMRQS
jgi:hypothetical protein